MDHASSARLTASSERVITADNRSLRQSPDGLISFQLPLLRLRIIAVLDYLKGNSRHVGRQKLSLRDNHCDVDYTILCNDFVQLIFAFHSKMYTYENKQNINIYDSSWIFCIRIPFTHVIGGKMLMENVSCYMVKYIRIEMLLWGDSI